MRILLAGKYQWVNATWNCEREFFDVVGQKYFPESVLAIEDDTRNQYVTCKACGEKFINTEEERTKHLNLKHNIETCFTCPYLRIDRVSESSQYSANDDNRTFAMHHNVILNCVKNGLVTNILMQPTSCKYENCAEDTIVTFEDVFTKYPKCFDELLCVDALMNNSKWLLHINSYESVFESLTRLRLEAYIDNETGIIDHFVYRYRNECFRFRYSAKYDKIFWIARHTYQECPPYRVDESKLKTILNIIKPLYKGE